MIDLLIFYFKIIEDINSFCTRSISLKNVQFIAIKMFHLYEIEGDEGHEVMWFWRVNNKKRAHRWIM